METPTVETAAILFCTDSSAEAAARIAQVLSGHRLVPTIVRPGEPLPAPSFTLVAGDVRHPLVQEGGAARLRVAAASPRALALGFGDAADEADAWRQGFDAFIAMPLSEGALHTLGTAARCARGADRVTSLEREVQALTAKGERLGTEVREHSDFLQNLTHELATPLTPLMGYLKLLRSGRLGPLTDKQYQVLDSMANAAERLEHSLDNLVDYAALQSGRDRVVVAEFDACALVDECVRDVHPKARAKHVLLDARHPKAALLRGDARKLRQALVNVVENAVRYSPHGGHVLVELTESAERMVFSVFDQGPGLPADAQNVTAHARRDDRVPGAAGLGLPVTRQIVEAHRGGLLLESPPREQPDARELFTGSKVAFWIPKVA